MAQETLEELMFRLRLNDDELNQQFLEVSETLKQNLDRINRQRNLVDIQARIELAGLDKATDATQIFQVRQRQLQNQLDAAKAKMQLLNTVYRETAQRTGETSAETQRAQIRYEQARLAVARLERQMRQLNETQDRAGQSTTNWLNKLIQIGGAIRNLEEVKEVLSAIADATVRLNERFKELEKTAYDFSLPFDAAREFADKVKLAGGELEDIGGFLRGLTDAVVKGETDDPEWITLEKYGAEIMDETGRLKDYAEIMEEVHNAYLKAKAEGSEIEFLQMIGGESGVTDAAQIMERWGEATEDAAKVVKAALDPAELRESERAINLLTLQMTEFADALSQFLSPATAATAESFFEIFRNATSWLTENKDLIKETAWEVARFFGAVPDIDFSLADKSLLKTAESADKLKSSLQGLTKGSDNNPLSQYGITRTNQYRDEIENLRLELDFVDEFKRALAQIALERERAFDQTYLSDDEKNAINEYFDTKTEKLISDQLKAAEERAEELMKETSSILASKDLSPYDAEIQKIKELEQQGLDSVQKLIDAFGRKNDFIKESEAIVANALAKETEAFERELDRIKGKTQSLAEKIFEQQHSRRDVDIMRAQKQWHEYTQESLYPQEMIDEWYFGERQAIARRARDSGRSYTKAPRKVSTSNLPDVDFYGQVRDRVNQAMSQVDSPAFNLQSQHEEVLRELGRRTQQIADVTSEIGGRVADLSKNETRTINLTVNPDINLAGAYVFDNSMKKQLTDEITTEVADAVKQAVETGLNQNSYSYGS